MQVALDDKQRLLVDAADDVWESLNTKHPVELGQPIGASKWAGQAVSIAGGALQIQRNIVATRALGLPAR
jgi:hypothetical protein